MDIRTCKAHQVKGEIIEAYWKQVIDKLEYFENNKIEAIYKQMAKIRLRPEVKEVFYDETKGRRTVNVNQWYIECNRSEVSMTVRRKKQIVGLTGDGIIVKFQPLLMRAGTNEEWRKTEDVTYFIPTHRLKYNYGKDDFHPLPVAMDSTGQVHACWGGFGYPIAKALDRNDYVNCVDLIIEYIRFGNYSGDIKFLRAWPQPTLAEIEKLNAY